jgi:hypothetical protein
MPKRQAVTGEVTDGVAATYVHGEEAAAEVSDDVREGIREMVCDSVSTSCQAQSGHWYSRNTASLP